MYSSIRMLLKIGLAKRCNGETTQSVTVIRYQQVPADHIGQEVVSAWPATGAMGMFQPYKFGHHTSERREKSSRPICARKRQYRHSPVQMSNSDRRGRARPTDQGANGLSTPSDYPPVHTTPCPTYTLYRPLTVGSLSALCRAATDASSRIRRNSSTANLTRNSSLLSMSR